MAYEVQKLGRTWPIEGPSHPSRPGSHAAEHGSTLLQEAAQALAGLASLLLEALMDTELKTSQQLFEELTMAGYEVELLQAKLEKLPFVASDRSKVERDFQAAERKMIEIAIAFAKANKLFPADYCQHHDQTRHIC